MKNFLKNLSLFIIIVLILSLNLFSNVTKVEASGTTNLLDSSNCSVSSTYREYPEGFGEGEFIWNFSPRLTYSQYIFSATTGSINIGTQWPSNENKITPLNSYQYLITGEIITIGLDIFVSNANDNPEYSEVLGSFYLREVGFDPAYDFVHPVPVSRDYYVYFSYGITTDPKMWREIYKQPAFQRYGSNKPLPIYLGKGILNNHKLYAAGRENIIQRDNESIPIVVYAMPLFMREGFNEYQLDYYQKTITISKYNNPSQTVTGEIHYLSNETNTTIIPKNYTFGAFSSFTFNAIVDGYVLMGFSSNRDIAIQKINNANTINYLEQLNFLNLQSGIYESPNYSYGGIYYSIFYSHPANYLIKFDFFVTFRSTYTGEVVNLIASSEYRIGVSTEKNIECRVLKDDKTGISNININFFNDRLHSINHRYTFVVPQNWTVSANLILSITP